MRRVRKGIGAEISAKVLIAKCVPFPHKRERVKGPFPTCGISTAVPTALPSPLPSHSQGGLEKDFQITKRAVLEGAVGGTCLYSCAAAPECWLSHPAGSQLPAKDRDLSLGLDLRKYMQACSSLCTDFFFPTYY